MKKKKMLKKGLALLVVLLCLDTALVSVGLASEEKSVQNNERVSIAVGCSLLNNREKPVELSTQEVETLQDLINTFKTDLSLATSKKDTIQLFNQMVIDLYNLGVLPSGLSIKQAQRLVIRGNDDTYFSHGYDRWNTQQNTALPAVDNTFCLVAGNTDTTNIEVLRMRFLSSFYKKIIDNTNGNQLYFMFQILLLMRGSNVISRLNFLPLLMGSSICLGGPSYPFGPYYSSGWVHSIGLSGVKKWDGSLIGTLEKDFICMLYDLAPGISGFTGINIKSPLGNFYFGSALQIGIDYEEEQ